MSVDLSGEITAIATAVLAVFAIVTAWYARRAFLKQSQEVSDQASMLQIQSAQLSEQQRGGERQAEVLALQADELRESLKQRERDTDDRRRGQAARVAAWFGFHESGGGRGWGAIVRNGSDLPILNVRTFFHRVREDQPGGDWEFSSLEPGPVETIRVMPPNQDHFVRIPADFVVGTVPKQISDTWVVSVEFTDAAGNRWERDPRGALHFRT